MEIETPAVEPETDHEFGKAFYFRGEKLEPLSNGRLTAYRRLKIGYSPEEQFESNYSLLYICKQSFEKFDKAREDGGAQLRKEAGEWSDKLKLSPASTDLVETANAIWQDYVDSHSEPDLKNEPGTESPNE